MAYSFQGEEFSLAEQLSVGASKIQPPHQDAGFIYLSDSYHSNTLFEHLNREIFLGQYPAAQYDKIINRVFVLSNQDNYTSRTNEEIPEDNEVVTIIQNPGYGEISVANEKDFSGWIKIGTDINSKIQKLIDLSQSKEVSYGLDDLLGYGYLNKLQSLQREGELGFENLAELKNFLTIFSSWNSFSSCALYLYELISTRGLLFETIDSLIDKAYSELDLDNLINSVKSAVFKETEPQLLNFIAKGTDTVREIESIFEKILTYLPGMDYLIEIFWSEFNKNLEQNKKLFDFLTRFLTAKNEFENEMYKAGGEEIYRQIMGPQGQKILKDSAKHAELMIGGGLFGAIPFLIGTIYQIIYDIVNLVINLCWYAFWATSGIVQWLFTSKAEEEKDMVSADKSLLEMFSFGFDIEMNEIPKMLYTMASDISSLLKSAIDSFVENAKEFGNTAGKMLGSAMVSITSGALSLITSQYPKKPTLWNRFFYIIRQWFNIGCLIGPIIVDIVLLFCSGGVTGIFSGAAKLGKASKVTKLGNVNDMFRFFTHSKEFIKSMTFYQKIDSIFPPRLLATGQKLLAQLRTITLNAKNHIKLLIEAGNEFLAQSSKALEKAEIEKLASKMDLWYDVASVVDLFAAIAFFFIGGDKAKINENGKVISG